jgi:Xaa-Pro dipeptidase
MIAELIAAETRARELFAECIRRNLVVAGKTERELSNDVFALAAEMFGVKKYWHKRIVRAGPNTMLVYAANPPDHTLTSDDILYFDFGPIFDGWEADLGLTLVLGNDPHKHRLAADVASAWDAAVAHFRASPALTASELYAYCGELARRGGWELGHIHCGHLVGKFPHEDVEGDGDTEHLRADNHLPLRRLGGGGTPVQWILEIHFIDRAAGIGGFQEALLLESDP